MIHPHVMPLLASLLTPFIPLAADWAKQQEAQILKEVSVAA
jgi:hypothetical protein